MGQSGSHETGAIPTISSIPIPRTFNYYNGTNSVSKLGGTLGPSEARPLLTYVLPRGYWGKMTIHRGTNTDSPPLAQSKYTGTMGKDFEITLPDIKDGAAGGKHILRYDVSWTKEKYWFGMDIGGAVERFEWRHSSGDEVKSVGRWRWGWKLVRTNRELPEGQKNRTSDGKEVVAAWAPATKTLSKQGELQFLEGSSGEELGDLWKLMAAISLLCILQKELQSGIASASASGA